MNQTEKTEVQMKALHAAMIETLANRFRESHDQQNINILHETAQLTYDAGFFLHDVPMLPSVRKWVQEKLKETDWKPEEWNYNATARN